LVDQMAYINTDRTGKFLLAASYVGAKLAIYPINAQSIVEAKPTQILDTKPKAHCVVIDAGNKNVYVPVLGGDLVMELKFDATTGVVAPKGQGEAATKPGAGPRHLTFHPNGGFAGNSTPQTREILGTLREIAHQEIARDCRLAGHLFHEKDNTRRTALPQQSASPVGLRRDARGCIRAVASWS